MRPEEERARSFHRGQQRSFVGKLSLKDRTDAEMGEKRWAVSTG